ncbi:hypothetical protein F5I97DRAFT_1929226 [Phlebopus sp. FC_14]|nr:hypothetical protein F5I97DRAFT_1929226 [Phlebopus sp. FC_14]
MTSFAFHGFWMTATGAFVSTVNPYELESVVHLWSFIALAPLTGIVTSMTQGFFCWRLWVVRRNRMIPVFVMMLSLLQLVSITYLALTTNLFPIVIENNITVTGSLFPASRSPFVLTWLGSSLLCDLIITGYMTLSLFQYKSRYLQSNHSPIPGLIKLTIETGLVTTIAALLELILATVFSSTQYHVAV